MLTAEEKTAGRTFRDFRVRLLDQHNADNPPTHVVPDFIALFRHLCSARHGRSTAMELKEIYVPSPIYPEHGVEAGRFGFIYREGRCRGCGQSARSGEGRIVDGRQRPPISGRVARS